MNEGRPFDIGAIYDNQAESFDSFAFQSQPWETIEKPCIVRNLKDLVNSNTRIVDLGCGSGRLIKSLVELGANPQNITGVDLSQKLLDKATDRFPQATYIQSDLGDLHLEDNSFDLAASSMVFQYFDNETLQHVLEAASKYLVKDGVLFFLATHPVNNASFEAKNYGSGWRIISTPWGRLTPNYCGTVGDYIIGMKKAGFEIENWEDLSRTKNDTEELFRIAIKGKRM